MALLSVRNVTMAFGSLIANDDVTFDVEEGTIVGLIGPNGAGKTTLFNCISGVYKPTKGSITFDGKEIAGLPAYKTAMLGAVRTFQVVNPLKEMTVLDNVLVGALLRHPRIKDAVPVAQNAIALCHLEEFADKKAGDLPIGTKKRLEMARAIATEARLLMLDEAMAGLTTTELNEAVALIQGLRKKGYTLLVVEHIMEAIMPVVDKLIVLVGGKKAAEGTPEEIIHNEKVLSAYLGQKYYQKMKKESSS